MMMMSIMTSSFARSQVSKKGIARSLIKSHENAIKRGGVKCSKHLFSSFFLNEMASRCFKAVIKVYSCTKRNQFVKLNNFCVVK